MKLFCKLRTLPLILIYLCSDVGFVKSSEDYYTSLFSLKKLATFEQEIVGALDDYVRNLEIRIQLAKKYLSDYEKSVLTSVADISDAKPQNDAENIRETSNVQEKFRSIKSTKAREMLAEKITAHPLMAFRLIRRFAQDLYDFEKHLRKDYDKGFLRILEKTRKGQVLPKVDDINGATEAILRIQDAYNVDVTDFSSGKFIELETYSGLTAADMNYVGMYALNANIYTRAIEWLLAAYQLAVKELPPTITPEVVFEKLQNAIAKHNRAKHVVPANVYLFQTYINANLSNWNTRQRVLDTKNYKLYIEEASTHDLTNFAALCRGEILRTAAMTKDLSCWYDTKDYRFTLDPIKVEKHHHFPLILQYYDILSESVISRLVDKTLPRMARSKVQGMTKNSEVISAVRTSTTTWIPEKDHLDIAKIPKYTQFITGLNLLDNGAAEDLQVTSYGMGGHYNPHYDNLFNPEYLPTMDSSEIAKGDRLATVLYYLSAVEAGGGTAFPKLGVLALPVKGSAIFWQNMKNNGDKELLALHGGCPILFGTKIVANKWIRANGQMFTRRCSSVPNSVKKMN